MTLVKLFFLTGFLEFVNYQPTGWFIISTQERSPMKKRNQYEKILRVSANLISQKGYHGVSLQQIANKMRLHKSSLFHYFKNKEELILRILEASVDKASENLKKITGDHELTPKGKLKKAIEVHLSSLLTEHRANATIYLNELRSLSRKNQKEYLMKRKKYQRDFEKIIEGMKGEGYFRGLDPKIVTAGILGMLNWTTRWYKETGPLTIQEISDHFYGIVTKT
jgi:AcrR family transcriptional regulator